MVEPGQQPWVPLHLDLHQGPRWDPTFPDGGPLILPFITLLSRKLWGMPLPEKVRWTLDKLKENMAPDPVHGNLVPVCEMCGLPYVYARFAHRAPSINRIHNRDQFGIALEYTAGNSTIATASLNISQQGDATSIGDLLAGPEGLLRRMRKQFQQPQGDAEPFPESGGLFVEGDFRVRIVSALGRCVGGCIHADARQNQWSQARKLNFLQTYTQVIRTGIVETFVRQQGRCAISRVGIKPHEVSIDRIDNNLGHFPRRVVGGFPVQVRAPGIGGNPGVFLRYELTMSNCRLIVRMLQGGAHRKFCRGWLLEIFINSPLDFGRTDQERAAAQTELDGIIGNMGAQG